jgi:CspA family cold shock protein
MPTGVVKWYNSTKGFGFIAPEGGGKDVFVHVSAVQQAGHGDPQEGDRIGYDVEKGRDGRESAINLRPPEG